MLGVVPCVRRRDLGPGSASTTNLLRDFFLSSWSCGTLSEHPAHCLKLSACGIQLILIPTLAMGGAKMKLKEVESHSRQSVSLMGFELRLSRTGWCPLMSLLHLSEPQFPILISEGVGPGHPAQP